MKIDKISARNVIKGKVVSVKKGQVAAEVTLDIGGGNLITATITVGSTERLGLKEGVEAAAVVKASDVMLAIVD